MSVDIKTFAADVQTMRNCQKKFFSDRKPSDLQASKMYEKLVDEHVKSILNPEDINQTTLEL